mgnify:CR=1 FL=1
MPYEPRTVASCQICKHVMGIDKQKLTCSFPYVVSVALSAASTALTALMVHAETANLCVGGGPPTPEKSTMDRSRQSTYISWFKTNLQRKKCQFPSWVLCSWEKEQDNVWSNDSMYVLVAIKPSYCDNSCHANMMAVAILSVWQLPYCHYGSCHIVIMAVATLLWSGCHAWIKVCYKTEFTEISDKKIPLSAVDNPFGTFCLRKHRGGSPQ